MASASMDTPLNAQSVVVATAEQLSCALGEESVILNLKSSTYYGMNPVGTFIWNLLQVPRRVGELHGAVLGEYDVDADLCERDLIELLDQMLREELICFVSPQ